MPQATRLWSLPILLECQLSTKIEFLKKCCQFFLVTIRSAVALEKSFHVRSNTTYVVKIVNVVVVIVVVNVVNVIFVVIVVKVDIADDIVDNFI